MKNNEIAVFASGCFWCSEAVFRRVRGVVSVISGYTGGTVKDPSYEEVSGGETGHAEAVKIEFDPSQISYRDLLEIFFATHDPTTPNRQGNDIGSQYRSMILYVDDMQKQKAEDIILELQKNNVYSGPIVTEVRSLSEFYQAEDYHQDFYAKNPNQGYCQAVINPKLDKFRKKFTSLLKDE